jgi:hypothetical protein
MSFAILDIPLSLEDDADADPCFLVTKRKNKNRRPDVAPNLARVSPVQRRCCRPVVGPEALVAGRRSSFSFQVACQLGLIEKIRKINGLEWLAESADAGDAAILGCSCKRIVQRTKCGHVACRVSGGGFSSRRDARRYRPDRKPDQ